MSDMHELRDSLGETLTRLGVGQVEVLMALNEEWDDLAGEPWSGKSRPVVIRNNELVVEVWPAAFSRMLMYASGDLIRRLDDRFGPGTVDSVRVQPARRP